MALRSMLYEREIRINEQISIVVPTVGEILEDEDAYYSLVSLITATPYDMMVQLDDIGVDYCDLDDYGLFLLMFQSLKSQDVSLIFKDIDISGFSEMVNTQNGLVVLYNPKTKAVIDRSIHEDICSALRRLHNLKRNNSKPGNNAAKKYLLKRARIKMKRRANKVEESRLEELIVAVVNTEQFHYGFEDVGGLTIYQFGESVQQIIKKVDYDNRMHGVYAGTLSASKLSPNELNWLTHK